MNSGVHRLVFKQKDALARAKTADDAGNAELAAQYRAEAQGWSEGGKHRVAMHVAGGALTGGLGSGSLGGALGGGSGAGLSAQLAGTMSELSRSIAESNPTGRTDVNEALGNIVANVLSGAAGGVAGGGTGAFAAANVDQFNRQLHDNEKKAIADKAGDDKVAADKLTKAACYAVKCWAQYAPGSAAYSEHYVSQLEASQLGPEFAWVDRQKEAGLFEYTPLQKIGDAVQGDPVGVAKDAVKVVLGGATAKTGATICATTGVGCATAGGWMFAFGLSDMAEGSTGLYNRYNGINSPGTNWLRYGLNQVTPIWGDTAYDAANLAFSIAALKASVPLKVGTADGLNRPGSMFDVTVSRINNATLIPLLNQALPHGTTQGILLFGIGSKGATIFNDVRDIGEKK